VCPEQSARSRFLSFFLKGVSYVKRLFLILAGVVLICITVLGLKSILTSTKAQTPPSELLLAQLQVPNNSNVVRVRSVSNDGRRVVFESPFNYTGLNADGNNEIWVKDADSPNLLQITQTTDFTDATGANVDVDNYTPAFSGNGTKIVFASNAPSLDARSPNSNGNYELYLYDFNVNTTRRITNTGRENDAEILRANFTNFSPSINEDGTVVAFETSRQTFNATDVLSGFVGNNPDLNGELMVAYIGATSGRYAQITVSDPASRPPSLPPGGLNRNPKLSGNGQMLMFISDYNYDNNKNSDMNAEIYHCRLSDNNLLQITQTAFPVDTYKAVVPVFDTTNQIFTLNIGAPTNVLDPFSKPINRDGSLLVIESSGNLNGGNPNRARQIWLVIVNPDRSISINPITNQGVSPIPTQQELATVDHTFAPSINPEGTFISFNSTRNFVPTSPSSVSTDNADASKEIFGYDLIRFNFRQLTFTDISLAILDQRYNTTSSFVSDTSNPFGDLRVSFNYSVQSFLSNATNIIDFFQVIIRPITSANNPGAAFANAASFDTSQVIARGSLAVVINLPIPDAPLTTDQPYILNGVSVKVGTIAARILSIAGNRVQVIIPNGIANGSTTYSVNDRGVQYTGSIMVVDGSPGLFTDPATGAMDALCQSNLPNGSVIYSAPPCQVSNGSVLSILLGFGTGWRNSAGGVQVRINDRVIDAGFAGADNGNTGIRDQFNIIIPSDLSGLANADVSVILRSNSLESNRGKISFLGPPTALAVDGLMCQINNPGVPEVYIPPPCPVSNETTLSILLVWGSGWRNAAATQLRIGDELFSPGFSGPRAAGGDQINLIIPPSFAGRTGPVSVLIPGTTLESNAVNVSFLP
jgi:uncharacterized protein (TIGR03437 family)